MQEMAQQILNQDKNTMNDTQREIIERAIQNDGKVSTADYERAWQAYNQCIVDKGYNPQPLVQIEGIYLDGYSLDTSYTEELQQKFENDESSCLCENVLEVQSLYKASKGNPNLLTGDDAIVDCLRRENLVPKSYTVKNFSQDQTQYTEIRAKSGQPFAPETLKKAAESLSFDLDNNAARLCLATNGANVLLRSNAPRWHPFK
ncbi:hypothetical protein [Bifidobacterium dolichotidis]|uniref:hypothetical protein n=1 Tax=Bifidobacterium dolichotidis TaxID=2306976 RepID=UPI000F7EA98E|nr:hypothetical protein [Bifidobacterium dolichotidis]